jgi:predicted transcriptional regulator
MSKTITLRISSPVYEMFRTLAERDNRSLSNFIETAALRFVTEHEFVDEYEMAEIRSNKALNDSLKKAVGDAQARRGRFV